MELGQSFCKEKYRRNCLRSQHDSANNKIHKFEIIHTHTKSLNFASSYLRTNVTGAEVSQEYDKSLKGAQQDIL